MIIDPMKNLPLSDLKIVDLSQYISGAYCTRLLASFGAEVIEIENPDKGDILRSCDLFHNLNTNKKSVTLNLESKTGSRILSQLIERADVLIENLGPGKVDCQSLFDANPSLVMTSVSYFGQTGPYRNYKGSDIVAQALGGIMKLTGLPEREPLKIAGPQAEFQAGINAAIATMSALFFRDKTGSGQHIDISVMECVASILEGALLSNSYNGTIRERDGSRHPTVYPSSILPCKDGYVHVDASADWENFAAFMEMPELLSFSPENLREEADEIDFLLIPALENHSREELFHRAQEWRLPFAMIMETDELPNDPQFQARGFFTNINEHTFAGTPFKMSECEPVTGSAPILGEHNHEIYCDLLGYTKEEVIQLRGMGII